MTKRWLFVMIALSAVQSASCERVPSLRAYRDAEFDPKSTPLVIVGRIMSYAEVGNPHPSRWDPDQPMQICRVTVQVENVLQGTLGSTAIAIYYLISTRINGPPHMGMEGRSGHWKRDTRLICFLRRDAGVFRTVVDTWDVATPTVLTGAHPNYKPQPGESIADSVIDILLDRGEGCDNAQWAHAISFSTAKAEFFDLAYTVRKLRQIMATHRPEAREAAEKELDELSYSWPKIRQGWPETDQARKR